MTEAVVSACICRWGGVIVQFQVILILTSSSSIIHSERAGHNVLKSINSHYYYGHRLNTFRTEFFLKQF
jgi:hypothetical protein